MTAPARRSTARIGYDGFEADDRFAYGELLPGERNGPPIGRRGSRATLRGFFLLIVFGGGWALLDDRVGVAGLAVGSDRGSVCGAGSPGACTGRTSLLDGGHPRSIAGTASSVSLPMQRPSAAPAQPPASAARPDDAARPPRRHRNGCCPPSAAVPYAAVERRTAPPTADPADPYQMRAAAVGLHPDLSRVLLARLSPDRLPQCRASPSRPPWPRRPTMASSSGRVSASPNSRFSRSASCAGAAPGCRRYVVTVTKDGWLTTAPPMEKCGPKSDAPGRG